MNELLLNLLDVFNKFPSAIWGLVGTVGGSLATLLVQRKSQEKDRNISTRKQVYFEACDALAIIQTSIANMVNSSLSDSSPDPRLSASLMRLHVVGNAKLIENLMEFQKLYAEACLDIGPIKLEVEDLERKNKHALDMHKNYLDLHKEWVNKLSVNNSEESNKEIQRIIDEWATKMNVCMDYANSMDTLIPPLQVKLLEKCFEHTLKLSKPGSDCIVEMRKDLDIPLSKAEEIEYLSRAKNARDEGGEKLKTFVTIFKDRIMNSDFPNL